MGGARANHTHSTHTPEPFPMPKQSLAPPNVCHCPPSEPTPLNPCSSPISPLPTTTTVHTSPMPLQRPLPTPHHQHLHTCLSLHPQNIQERPRLVNVVLFFNAVPSACPPDEPSPISECVAMGNGEGACTPHITTSPPSNRTQHVRHSAPHQKRRFPLPKRLRTPNAHSHTPRPRPCAKGPAHPPFPHHTPPHSSPRPPPPTPRGLHSWSQCYAVPVPQNHESKNGGMKDEGGQAAVPHKQKRTKAHPAQRCYGRLEKMHNRSTTQTHWCVKCI